MGTLEIVVGVALPEEELSFVTSRSGGPGGQNVNKLETRVTLRFDLAASPSCCARRSRKRRRARRRASPAPSTAAAWRTRSGAASASRNGRDEFRSRVPHPRPRAMPWAKSEQPFGPKAKTEIQGGGKGRRLGVALAQGNALGWGAAGRFGPVSLRRADLALRLS